jgi:membrane-associated protease RseP (regulator of RpoE activity)
MGGGVQRWLGLAGIGCGAAVLLLLVFGDYDSTSDGPSDAEAPGNRPGAPAEVSDSEASASPGYAQRLWEALVGGPESQDETAKGVGLDSQRKSSGGGRGSGFDEAVLIESGMRPSDVTRLRERFEQAESERAQLRGPAIGEGRNLTPEELDELDEIEDQLEQELGPDDYDRMLYAAGEDNRVRVTKVLSRSPGEGAGFMPGDVVLSYDGKPVFKVRDFRTRLREGPPGSSAPIEYQRGDQILTDEIRTGPPGMFLEGFSQEP